MSDFQIVSYNIAPKVATVFTADGESYPVTSDNPNFPKVVSSLVAGTYDGLEALLCKGKEIQAFTKGLFTYADGVLSYRDGPIPHRLNLDMVERIQKAEDYEPLMRFFTKLMDNPSNRSVTQLYTFVTQAGIPLSVDGDILTYKKVKSNYFDCHTGKTHCYKPGTTHEMPRNQISDDPGESCAAGLHVGAMGYVKGFSSGRVILCKVNPRDVVSVPNDYNCQKMRVCRLEVIGDYEGTEPIMDLVHDVLEPAATVTVEVEVPVGQGGAVATVPSATPVKKTLAPAKPKAPAAPKVTQDQKFDAMDAMNRAGLMTVSVKRLRKYCSAHLGLTGSAHFPGGKKGLVTRILQHRKASK